MHAKVGIRRTVAALLALSLSFGLLVSLGSPAAQASTRRRTQMLQLTNDARHRHDIRALALTSRLSRYARRHSREMAAAGAIFHSTNLQGVLSPYQWSIGGENVGVGDSLQGLQDAFMASTEHRENILRVAFDHVGIGVVHRGGVYWVTLVFYG